MSAAMAYRDALDHCPEQAQIALMSAMEAISDENGEMSAKFLRAAADELEEEL